MQCRTGVEVIGTYPDGSPKTAVSDRPPDVNGWVHNDPFSCCIFFVGVLNLFAFSCSLDELLCGLFISLFAFHFLCLQSHIHHSTMVLNPLATALSAMSNLLSAFFDLCFYATLSFVCCVLCLGVRHSYFVSELVFCSLLWFNFYLHSPKLENQCNKPTTKYRHNRCNKQITTTSTTNKQS